MRAIKKNFNRPPEALLKNNLINVIDTTNSNHKKLIRQYIYGESTVVTKLLNLYNHKCAYCEAYEPEPEVEHYRPKKGVTDEVHSGYYWLCYEWSNLMPACHDCNKKRSKGNHFPIEGTRLTTPVFNADGIDLNENKLNSNTLSVLEIPLILNPEFPGFDPFDYFKIDSNGKLIPQPNKSTLEFRKAIVTIDKIRLNRDKLLLGIRKREIRYYMNRIKIILYKYLHADFNLNQYESAFLEILTEINENCKVTKTNEYWFFWNYFLKNFKFFLIQYFKGRFRQGLINSYDNLVTRL
jgi:uncharacterized protein (TIGR02646 family)